MTDANPFADLLETPRMYPWRFDAANGRIAFVAMTPAAYRQSRFLDHRLTGATGPAYDVGLDKLVARFDREGDRIQPPAMRLVFHVGYTGSTLVSRCLEALTDALVLREPEPLRALAAAHAGTGPALPERSPGELLGLFSWLWSRAWHPEQPVIVKMTSAANPLLSEFLSRNPSTRALFVYGPLTDALLAAARHPARFGEARAKLAALMTDWPLLVDDAERPPPDPAGLDDFRAVAMVWWAYMRLARRAEKAADGRLRLVDFTRFLAEPGTTLGEMADHLGLAASSDAVDAVVSGPLMATHAKSSSDSAYDRADRETALQTAYATHRDAVDSAARWAHAELPGFDERDD